MKRGVHRDVGDAGGFPERDLKRKVPNLSSKRGPLTADLSRASVGLLRRPARSLVWKKVDGQWRLHRDIWNAQGAWTSHRARDAEPSRRQVRPGCDQI